MNGLKTIIITGALAVGCHGPSPGGSCATAGYLCQDAQTALECREQGWVAIPCKGALGCRAGTDYVTCDWTGNAQGDACPSMDVGMGICASTGASLLTCTGDGITAAACGCVTTPHGVTCEQADGGTGGHDGGTAVVGVTVSLGGVPQPAINVVFQDPKGAPLAHLQTDSEGHASSLLSEGSMVTVALPAQGSPPTHLLWSWLGVQPGDELSLALPAAPTSMPNLGTIAITLPPALPGATGYDLGTCNGTFVNPQLGMPVQVTLESPCAGDLGGFDLLSLAYGGGAVAGYSLATVSAPAFGGPNSLTMPAWQTDLLDFGLQLTKAPAADTVSTRIALVSQGLVLRTLATTHGPIPAGGGSTSLANIPGNAGDSIYYQAALHWADGASSVDRRVSKASLTQNVDLTGDLLPRVHAVSVDLTDEARPAIHWTADGPLGGADAEYLVLSWDPSHYWFIEAPPDTVAPVQVPTLPNALAAWRPSGASYLPPAVVFIDDSTVSGWSEARTTRGSTTKLFDEEHLALGTSRRLSVGGGF